MARKPTKLEVELQVEYIPMPVEHVPMWEAGLKLLLEILRNEEPIIIAETAYERMDIDSTGDAQRGIPALLPMDEIAQR